MEITSAENKRIKDIVKLGNKKKFRDKQGVLIVEGVHLLQEIIKSKKENLIQEIFYTEKSLMRNGGEVKKILNKFEEYKKVLIPDFLMDKISTTKTPQGLLLVVKKPETKSFKSDNFIVLLDNVSNSDNIGSIIRNGISFGVSTFILSGESADPWGPKAIRASQGAHFHGNIITDYSLKDIKKEFDGKVYGTFLDKGAKSLYEINFDKKIALCFGNEGSGISPELEEIFDEKIYIPMENNFESLNVSSAAAATFSEVLRQKLKK